MKSVTSKFHISRTKCLSSIYWSLFLITFLSLTASAGPTPKLVSYPAFTTIDESTLYIHGGRMYDGNYTNQFYTLDLTQAYWPLSNPPWKELGSDQGQGQGMNPEYKEWMHSMTVSKDRQSLVVLGMGEGLSIYNITNRTWESYRGQVNVTLSGLSIVTDPNSGRFYVPSGSVDGESMLVIDLSRKNQSWMTTVPMHPLLEGAFIQGYSTIWSTLRNSLLMYGGVYRNASNLELFEFLPSNNTWTILATAGPSPTGWKSQCMVSAQNGSKAIVFGQLAGFNEPAGEIYTLDLSNLTWVKGANIDPKLVRSGMACTVHQDTFLAWGGDNGNSDNATASLFMDPIGYDIKEGRWVSQFGVQPPPPSADTDNNGSEPEPPNYLKRQLGTLIGSIIGGLALLAIAFVIIFRNTCRRRKPIIECGDSSEDIEKIKVPLNHRNDSSELPYDREKVLIVEEKRPFFIVRNGKVIISDDSLPGSASSSNQRLSQGSTSSFSSSDSLLPPQNTQKKPRRYHEQLNIPLTAEIPYENSWLHPIKHEIQDEQEQKQSQGKGQGQVLVQLDHNRVQPPVKINKATKPSSKQKNLPMNYEIQEEQEPKQDQGLTRLDPNLVQAQSSSSSSSSSSSATTSSKRDKKEKSLTINNNEISELKTGESVMSITTLERHIDVVKSEHERQNEIFRQTELNRQKQGQLIQDRLNISPSS